MAEPFLNNPSPYLSIAIIAWNEEKAIATSLESLFAQTLFSELASRGQRCEILCLANGCTDNTVKVAAEVFNKHSRTHPAAKGFSCRACDVPTRGKTNAWNVFVHKLSAPESRLLMLMDADIIIRGEKTLWNMIAALEQNPEASVSVDCPLKDVSLKKRKSALEHLSAGASQLTAAGEAQLTAQLYVIRSEIARNIYLPRDLGACDDGFIKNLVCTDFLTTPRNNHRIVAAPDAAHVFEAYTKPPQIFRNQKRQIIGQTIIHLLIDQELPRWTLAEKNNLAATLRQRDESDPQWIKRLIQAHLSSVKYFWKLYPDLLTIRLKRLAKLSLSQRLRCLPTAVAWTAVNFLGAWAAWRFLRRGQTGYWPQASRVNLEGLGRMVSEPKPSRRLASM